MKNNLIIAGLVIIVIVFMLGFAEAYSSGMEAGRIQVSSGQYACLLIENADKTNDWQCSEVK